MDGINVIMKESIIINVMLEETVPASSVQELLDMEGGVPQEPPSTYLTLETINELMLVLTLFHKNQRQPHNKGLYQGF